MTGEKRRRNLCSFISKTAGLLDRMSRAQHTLHFALQIFWKNFFPPQHLKNYVRYTKMHVRLPGEAYIICLDFTIICSKDKMLVFTLKILRMRIM
jgi:hypothetical protein